MLGSAGEGDAPEGGSPRPLPSLTRFDILETLGSGGMGTVYKAWEPALERHVAIKVLDSSDPDLARRFGLEAQAQARVVHGNVCQVYEVGEADGRRFIVMQFIPGRTLAEIAPELSVEQRLRLVVEVAGAVHAAHRTGLVHRDIKPGNILVERTADGELKSYVVDFGLAQDLEAPSLTRTGVIIGTPRYMAPEQALGTREQVDRRTDVYSLGAVLYELLGGMPPFGGLSEIQVLVNLVEGEPPPLRRQVPGIPVDLETIVMKCLSREPQRRYDSARALADELERYLDGRPIQARRASWAYLLARKARRHRAVVALSALFLVIVSALLVAGALERWRARERAELGRRFGVEAERVEGFLRYVHTLPLHDTSRERDVIRDSMEAMRDQMVTIGGLARAPGHYALGRAHLALGELDAARRELEAAWAAGYQDPEVALALGETLGELYREALAEAGRAANPELRQARKQQVQEALRDPALAFLRRSLRAGLEQSTLIEGQLAFYEERHDDALSLAGAALEAQPWLYEPLRLQALVHLALGVEHGNRGQHEAALTEYAAAGLALERAVQVARSDPAIYQAIAGRWEGVLEIEIQRGGSVDEAAQAALAALANALVADPGRVSAHTSRAAVFQRVADHRIRQGRPAGDELEQCLASARAALEIDPRASLADHLIGTAHLLQAMNVDLRQGRDPRPGLAEAAASYARALEIDPGAVTTVINRGTLFAVRAEYEMSHGLDPSEAFANAVRMYRRALDSGVSLPWVAHNLGNVQLRQAVDLESRGRDPRPAFAAAAATAEQAIDLNPSVAQGHNLLGAIWAAQGRWELEHGVDPRPVLDRALALYDRALECHPGYSLALNNIGEACLLRASYEVASGRLAEPWLDRAAVVLGEAVGRAPSSSAELHVQLARCQLMRSSLDIGARGLDNAREELQRALAINPRSVVALHWLGRAELEAAYRSLAARHDPGPALKAAGAALGRCLEANPRQVECLLALAETCLLHAEHERRAGRPPDGLVGRAGAALERVLDQQSQLPRALALQAAVLAAEARGMADPGERDSLLQAARQLEADALAANPLLEQELERLRQAVGSIVPAQLGRGHSASAAGLHHRHDRPAARLAPAARP